MSKNKANTITLNDVNNICSDLIQRNLDLINEGKTPVAICLEGVAGIGKTTFVEEYAASHNMTICKIMLSQMEEVGDLVGIPYREYKCVWTKKDGTQGFVWRGEKLLGNIPAGVTVTSESRMSYATPAWLPSEDNENGVLIVLDDYTRSSNMFQQAIMEIINTRSYVSWKLPKHSMIFLTSNPDDGSYNVASIDTAQKTRMLLFNVKFDINSWAQWAENKIDSRAINFALFAESALFGVHNNVIVANPRSYVNFVKMIEHYKDWNAPTNLVKIKNISKGAFPDDDDNIIGSQFVQFLKLKLDKLMTPEDMFTKPINEVMTSLSNSIFVTDDDGNVSKNKAISVLISNRILSYMKYKFESGNATKPLLNRFVEIVSGNAGILPEDSLFRIVQELRLQYPSRMVGMFNNPELRKRFKIIENE